jgi:hypothetical protein
MQTDRYVATSLYLDTINSYLMLYMPYLRFGNLPMSVCVRLPKRAVWSHNFRRVSRSAHLFACGNSYLSLDILTDTDRIEIKPASHLTLQIYSHDISKFVSTISRVFVSETFLNAFLKADEESVQAGAPTELTCNSQDIRQTANPALYQLFNRFAFP